ncbi:hypothetical protein RB595_006338 [Gaeumannomyces hyphopodioides]
MAPSRKVIPLDKGWEFRQADKKDAEFLPVAQFPTNVHLDLLAHGLIPDPFVGKNETDVQWIGEAQWTYRTTFSTPALPSGSSGGVRAVLAFDGLDTFATVLLNGAKILETDNMFVPERVDVTGALREGGGDNELVIHFDSAFLRGWKLVEKYPDHKWGCWNGGNSRLAVRKAQYHWGWDWGPALLTCGPWRPITLEVYAGRVADLHVDVDVPESLDSATAIAHAVVEGVGDKVRFEISLRGSVVAAETVQAVPVASNARSGAASATFHIQKPALWYPIRYGEQPLYKVKATLLAGDDETSAAAEVDTASKRIGLRRAELVQQPLKDQPGTSFFFRVNNVPIFCGGSNWIPADSFIPRISANRYRDWVKLVADGNQFMIRIWGGGIYEEQAIYDACDELGVLVWQDFLFGCGNYPTWPELLDSIRREARENVKLLRHHPSIVIWVGNNEDYAYAESVQLTYNYADKDPENWLKTDFPARYIYEKLLPDVCADLVPRTYYHPGSPWGGGLKSSDTTVGDLHQWNVWHGKQEKYQNFDKLVGRFVSEFGMEAFPSVRTIDQYLPLGKLDPDRYPQSSTVDFHNKADGHERRIALYLVENMRYGPDPLEHFVYSTQLMQAECLSSAYRLWKRQWKGPGREYCSGALVWQINDCWPVTSWAIADYYLRPKLAYFAVKREMAPLTVGITRREHQTARDKHTRVYVERVIKLEAWACSLKLEEVTVDVLLRAWNVETGEQTHEEKVAEGLVLQGNRSTELLSREVPFKSKDGSNTDNSNDLEEAGRTVVAVYLVDAATGGQLARYVNWPEPLKYLHLQKPTELAARLVSGGTVVEISAEVPVKGVALESEDDGVKFEDNLIDIVPGEVVKVGVKGADERTVVTTRYLGMLD